MICINCGCFFDDGFDDELCEKCDFHEVDEMAKAAIKEDLDERLELGERCGRCERLFYMCECFSQCPVCGCEDVEYCECRDRLPF